MIERERVRSMVREELRRRLTPAASLANPALGEILVEASGLCLEDHDLEPSRPCVIEPDRPCYNSGYCKKLGY